MPRSRVPMLCAVLAVAGCGDNRLAPPEPDAAIEVDARPPADFVTGRSAREHVTAGAIVAVDEDLGGHAIAAYLPDLDEPTGYRVIAGAVTAPGRFRIDGVPEDADYLLAVTPPGGAPHFFFTDRRDVDLSYPIAGRPDAIAATSPQEVTLSIGAMQPWQPGDRLVATTYHTATACTDLPAPAPGATALDLDLDWGGCASPALIDMAAGDRIEVAHVRSLGQFDASGRYQTVARTLDLFDTDGVTMAPGVPVTIRGDFTPVTNGEEIRFVYSRSMFDAGHDAETALGETAAALHASFGLQYGVLLGPPIASVTLTDWSRDGALGAMLEVPAGDGFAGELPRIYLQHYTRIRALLVPGATAPALAITGSRCLRPFTGAVPPGPDIGPPAGFQVRGLTAAAGGRVRLVDQRPLRVSWASVATATEYDVRVLRAADDAGTTRLDLVATFTTAGTWVEVPLELLAGGGFFAFELTAHRNGTLYADGRLRARGLPYSFASRVSGLFRIDATCGDGTTGPGEECDPGDVETAGCDVDCTLPVCGDGLANHAAGEACDTLLDSFGCDADCTLPVCGDGHRNRNLEDCDDGDVTDGGNGCSVLCKANNLCGDGVVQDAIEGCDPPGPACSPVCDPL